MTDFSRLGFSPLHREGWREGAASAAERWSWDFVVDGHHLAKAFQDDRMGVLGPGDSAWHDAVVRKLLRTAPPDLEPNRVALYVCPECFDMSCGAITAAIDIRDDVVTWSDFRWERDYDDPDTSREFPLGPFRFSLKAYQTAIRAAAAAPAGPSSVPLPAS